MKSLRVVFALTSLALLGPAAAEVHSLAPTQTLAKPASPIYRTFGIDVAIDGAHLIVLAGHDGGQSALLYRRNSRTGEWQYRRRLLDVPGPSLRASVSMKNRIAAVQFGDTVTLFEYSGGDYVRASSVAPIRHPGGLAISGNSVLVGGDGCDYDAVVYEKGTDGLWAITGRMDDNQGECQPEGLAVELNYDTALLRVPYTHEVTAWRRNGTALNWLFAGTLDVPAGTPVSPKPFTLQKSTAVGPGDFVFRRSGDTWVPQGRVLPVNYGNGAGQGFDVVYRDGVLVTTESVVYAAPYVYLETSPGQFQHVAVLNTSDSAEHHDVSNGTVVVAIRDWGATRFDVQVFDLPSQLQAPRPIVNDFEDGDVSDLTFSGGQFALATRGADDVLAQSQNNGRAIALVNASGWTDSQRVEADITPTAFASAEGWVGLIARYVDADNYYFVAIRGDGTVGVYRRRAGVDLLLGDGFLQGSVDPAHVALVVAGQSITVFINDLFVLQTTDAERLTSGRAGLVTSQAQADFDDIHVAATDPFALLTNEYGPHGTIMGRPFTENGGDWQVRQDEDGNHQGLSQSDLSGIALTYTGVAVENQEITARARLDAFDTSQTGAWFGLLARYVDQRTYYSVAVRSNNRLQIRKQVNGVVTVLASANFTPVPGRYHDFRFRVINDQLQLFVDQALVASTHDAEITRGRYGLATYRAAATWETFMVTQP